MGEGQKAQTSIYMTNMFWDVMYSMATVIYNTTLCI